MPECKAKTWTVEYMNERCGNNFIQIRKNTHINEYRVGKKYNIEQCKFSKYASLLLADSKEASKYYLAAQNLHVAFREVEEEFTIPCYVEKIHHGPFLWVGAKNHYEFCHVDPDDGIICMLKGKKVVRLYSNKQFRHLYPNPLGAKGRTIQSQVNCDKPSEALNPLFFEAICHECTLEPGDLLYIPAFWWHQVSSVDASISMNVFFGDTGESNYVEKLISQKLDCFSYWLLNVIEQNRSLENFPQILSGLPFNIERFLEQQFKEHPTEQQIGILVKIVMDYLNITELPKFEDFGVVGGKPPKLKIRGLLWRD